MKRLLFGLPFKNSVYFDGDDGGAGAGGTGGAGGEGGTGGEGEKKTFSQEELNRLFAKEKKDARSAERSEILKALGVDDIEKVKQILETQRQADEAKKTEIEKAQEKERQAQAEIERLKSEQEKVIAQANEQLLKAEVMREVVGFKDANGKPFRPEAVNDVFLLLDRTGIEKQENGTFKGVKEAVEKVAKERPHWLVETQTANSWRGTPKPNNGKGEGQGNNQAKTQTPPRPFTL